MLEATEERALLLAAGPGFEPGQADSKSAVLPLHNPASVSCRVRLYHNFTITGNSAIARRFFGELAGGLQCNQELGVRFTSEGAIIEACRVQGSAACGQPAKGGSGGQLG